MDGYEVGEADGEFVGLVEGDPDGGSWVGWADVSWEGFPVGADDGVGDGGNDGSSDNSIFDIGVKSVTPLSN